jgi:hypothetical protein
VKVRSDVSAPLAAGFADEPRLDVGQLDVVGPRISGDRDRVAALVVRAIDQETAHANRIVIDGIMVRIVPASWYCLNIGSQAAQSQLECAQPSANTNLRFFLSVLRIATRDQLFRQLYDLRLFREAWDRIQEDRKKSRQSKT